MENNKINIKKRLAVLPYTMKSMSSRNISTHFGCNRVYPDKNFKPKSGMVVVNWGFTGATPALNSNVDFEILNKPTSVSSASDKVQALQKLKDRNIKHVEFVLTKAEAKEMFNDTSVVYCRTLTRAKEGKGIVLSKNPEELVNARLYTKYFENDHEFRIHVFKGEVIDRVEKRKMSSERRAELKIEKTPDSKYIRNMKKAWSFCRIGIIVPAHIDQLAIDAVEALDLDFAAVDIVYNSNSGEAKVLELNTAPGQKKGTTTHFRYTKAISKYINDEMSLEDYNSKYNCNAENYIEEDVQEDDD